MGTSADPPQGMRGRLGAARRSARDAHAQGRGSRSLPLSRRGVLSSAQAQLLYLTEQPYARVVATDTGRPAIASLSACLT